MKQFFRLGAKAKKFTIGFVYLMTGIVVYLIPNAVYKMYYSEDIPESANQPLLWTIFATAFQLLFFFPVLINLVKKCKKPNELQIFKKEVRTYFCQSL